jgi:hypothetical protein
MTDECISPLRRRMIEDMSLRHFGEKPVHLTPGAAFWLPPTPAEC